MEVAVCRRKPRKGVDRIIAEATNKERLAVQVELFTTCLEHPHAETLAPRVDDPAILD